MSLSILLLLLLICYCRLRRPQDGLCYFVFMTSIFYQNTTLKFIAFKEVAIIIFAQKFGFSYHNLYCNRKQRSMCKYFRLATERHLTEDRQRDNSIQFPMHKAVEKEALGRDATSEVERRRQE